MNSALGYEVGSSDLDIEEGWAIT